MKFNSPEAGLVFDTQRFSIHDGPGIRTLIFFKGCPLRCIWCQNPESLKTTPEIAFYRERCELCKKCVEVCPEGCIDIHPARRIDRNKCTLCGECAEACNFEATRLIGRWYSADELLSLVEKDRAFYEESGGGVTLSGGEPSIQHEFAGHLAEQCRRSGLHVALETCGYFNYKKVSGLLRNTDLILFDIKVVNDRAHRRFTGRSNRLIRQNFSALASANSPLIPRMPLIPGYTTTPENIEEVIGILKGHSVNTIHLLPYHPMGESKLEPIESSLPPLKLSPLEKGEMEEIRNIFLKRDIDARII